MNHAGARILKQVIHASALNTRQFHYKSLQLSPTSTMVANLPITQGVFAVNKPQGVTSAQVLRDLQHQHFDDSKLFAGLLADERQKRASEPRSKARNKRDKRTLHVKMGHGGTLDPLATGVLIIAIGNGTKALPNFIGCTKSYETVCLFGASTDTYDITGKVIEHKSWHGVTKESVTQVLDKFKGKIMQRPPVYSALWINGRRAYDIAREGGDLPEMKEREVEVTQMELVEWLEPGAHDFKIPEAALSNEEKDAAEALKEKATKRKREDGAEQDTAEDSATKKTRTLEKQTGQDTVTETANAEDKQRNESMISGEDSAMQSADPDETPVMSGAIQPETPSRSPPKEESDGPPAARIRMTVSSGFYVRSLCHDLGAALGSAGHMASLVRTRQGDFALGENAMEISEFEAGEDEWSGKLKGLLDDWTAKNKDNPSTEQTKPRNFQSKKEKGPISGGGQKQRQQDRQYRHEQRNSRDRDERSTRGENESRGRPYQDRDRAAPSRRRNSSSDVYD